MSLPVHDQYMCDVIEEHLILCEPRLHRRMPRRGTARDRLRTCPARWGQDLRPCSALANASIPLTGAAVRRWFPGHGPVCIRPEMEALGLASLVRVFVLGRKADEAPRHENGEGHDTNR
jgi:hypothetical protein